MTATATIDDLAREFDRLFPGDVDATIASNGQRMAGYVGQDACRDDYWPTIGYSYDAGGSGSLILSVHPDDIARACRALARLSPGTSLAAVQDTLTAARVRYEI